MTQAYSNPARKNDPYALPDVEIFEVCADEILSADIDSVWYDLFCEHADELKNELWRIEEDCENKAAEELAGFYYWYCLPGCLPDSDPIGPFESYNAALLDAQTMSEEIDLANEVIDEIIKEEKESGE